MPDWITHIGVVWIICTLLNIKDKYIALIGAILPDLAKLALVALLITGINIGDFFYPFHTPIGVFLLAVFIASFFEEFKKAFLLLFFGTLIHLFLDALMWPWGYAGIALLFPITREEYGFNLIWPDDLRPMLLTIVGVIIVYFYLEVHKLWWQNDS